MNTIESLRGGLTLQTAPDVFALSTDSILLADFVRLRPGDSVCDLGCGAGILGLLLCGRDARCRVVGVELEPRACALASRNIARNALDGRFSLIHGDLRAIRSLLPAGSISHVVANPPYFPSASSAAPVSARAAARSEQTCSLDEVCAAAAWLLRWGGRFSVVYRPERLCDLFCALRACRLEPKRLRFVRHHPGAAVSLVLMEAVAGGGAGLSFEPDLLLHNADGTPSAEHRRIYHCEGGI